MKYISQIMNYVTHTCLPLWKETMNHLKLLPLNCSIYSNDCFFFLFFFYPLWNETNFAETRFIFKYIIICWRKLQDKLVIRDVLSMVQNWLCDTLLQDFHYFSWLKFGQVLDSLREISPHLKPEYHADTWVIL